MHRARTTALLAAAAAVSLTGCGGTPAEPAATVTVTAPSPTPSETEAAPEPTLSPSPTTEPTEVPIADEPEYSDRGRLLKEIGQPAGIGSSADDLWASLTVTSIEPDFECTGSIAEDPTNGHFIAVTIEAQVDPDALERDLAYQREEVDIDESDFTGWSFNDFGLVDADGVTVNEPRTYSTFSCLDEGQGLPDAAGPGETVRGIVILDSPSTTGAVTFTQQNTYSTGEWEWPF